MFFDKILDAFKLENLFPEKYQNERVLNPIEHNIKPSLDSNQQLLLLKNYWLRSNDYLKTEITYRTASFKEKEYFALIDILSCFSKGARNPDNFSPIMLDELGITNWNTYFNNLVKKDYLRSANINEILNANYSLNDLKVIADSVGVIKKGKKAELAARIAPQLPAEQVEQMIAETNLYSISSKGKQVLIENEDYILFHKYRHIISLAEFNDNRFPDGTHRRNFYDTMFQALSNRVYFYEANRNWELLYITHIYTYNLLVDESKKTDHTIHYDVILNHYIEYLYLLTCFCRHMCWAVKNKIFSNSLGGYVVPQPDAYVHKLADFESSINYELIFCNKPPSLLTNQEFKSYVHELLNEPMFNNGKWNSLLQKRVSDFYKLLK